MKTLGKILAWGGVVTGLVGVGFLALLANVGIYERSTSDVEEFKYHGKPAVVRHVDIFGPDLYYFVIDGKDRLEGELTADDGRVIRAGQRIPNRNHGHNNFYIDGMKQER